MLHFEENMLEESLRHLFHVIASRLVNLMELQIIKAVYKLEFQCL